MARRKSKKIAILGGSFNPPHNGHLELARMLSKQFNEVIVVPCGPRPDKQTTNEIDPTHRAAMVDIAFRGIPNVRTDLFDLENSAFTPAYALHRMFAHEGEPSHVVGVDLISGGSTDSARIQTKWKEGRRIWHDLTFVVSVHPEERYSAGDLPPHSSVIQVKTFVRSSEVRKLIFLRKPFENLVHPDIAEYITRHGLYRGMYDVRPTHLVRPHPRALIIADDHNPKALELHRSLTSIEDSKNSNLIIVIGGDGAMLHAIRRHWRMRIPFYGINVGYRGFLLNQASKNISPEIFTEPMITWQCPMLLIETAHADSRKSTTLAFNDAWVQAEPGKSAWVEVSVGGKVRIPRLEGDGVLLATAAGSTGYARAMGAPPLPVGERLLVLAGSHVIYPAHWKSAILSFDAGVHFKSLDTTPSPKKRPIFGFVDGTPQGEVLEMSIRTSRVATAEIAFSSQHDLTEKLLSIQFPLNSDSYSSSNGKKRPAK